MSNLFETVRHEIKSPLVSIKAMVAILTNIVRSGKNEGEIQKYLSKLDVKSTMLDQALNQLIDIVQFKEKSFTLLYEFFDFPQLVDEVLQKKRRENRKIVFTREGIKNQEILADRSRIAQAIDIILSEIIQEEQVDHITVSIEREKKCISVNFFSQSKVFNTEAAKEKLGYLLMQEIIRIHGGKIVTETQSSKQSSFCFTLQQRPSKKA